jgi:hypothetical protein
MARLPTLLLFLAMLSPSAQAFVVPGRASGCTPSRVAASHRFTAAVTLIEKPGEKAESDREQQERDSLYTTPSFEFDATTITALLGVAIAFQFFVLANL